jgi:hypothetical protein
MSVTRVFILFLLTLGVTTATPPSGVFAADPPRRPTELPRPNGAIPQLRRTESKNYTIFTDMNDLDTREAALRLTRMFEEYAARTSGFAGKVNGRFPVYLFRNAGDYYTAGGMQETAGMFDGQRLLIVASEEVGPTTWHTLQHEGFHQFANAVINHDLPTWVEEGLAEYFGEGVWTGDGFITGVVPQWRLARVRETLAREEGFRPVADVMGLTLGQWNGAMSVENYDQAWTMVHFLVHAQNGRYRKAFAQFINAVGGGQRATKAWNEAFGDAAGFELKWREYWKTLPDDPTADAYDRASVATIASYWARLIVADKAAEAKAAAPGAGQAGAAVAGPGELPKDAPATFTAFSKSFTAGTLKLPAPASDNWLPPALLADAIKLAADAGRVNFVLPANQPPRVILSRRDGCRAIATINLAGVKIKSIDTSFDDSAKAIAEARRLHLLNEGKKAKALLADVLKRNPDSPLAGEVRNLMSTAVPEKPDKPAAKPTATLKPVK